MNPKFMPLVTELHLPASDNQFESFGEFLTAVRRDATHYRTGLQLRRDPRLTYLEERAQPAGSGEQIPADGGFLIPPEMAERIILREYNVGEIFKRCTQRPIKSSSFKFVTFDEQSRANGSRLGGVLGYWVNEADALTKSKPRYKLSEIQANKIICLLEATDELTQDAEAYGEQMIDALAQELVFQTENKIVTGDGANCPLGILNAPATIVVPKQSGQGAGTVLYSNVEQMISALWAKSYQSSGTVWLYNQALLPQLSILSVIVGTGGSESKAWQWASDPSKNDTLCGFDALPCEYCPVPGTPGDIILADLSRFYLAIRQLIRSEVSIHVLFLSDQNCFRVISRIGGQPIDHTPVTGLNQLGSQVTSPFVILAAR